MLSPATAKSDRTDKLPMYAREGVRYTWLVDPIDRVLEILRLEDGRWLILGIHRDEAKIRAEPFEAIELDLAVLWADVRL